MKDKGITLVALVITIIILLILAGITISQLTGNGLFENAKLAKEKSEIAQNKEESILSHYQDKINGYLNNSRNDITYNEDSYDCWKTWLYLAGEDPNLYKSDEILNNTELMQTIMSNKKAQRYLMNSKTFILPAVLNNEVAKEKMMSNLTSIPNMTSNTEPFGEASASVFSSELNSAWCAFTGFWTEENIKNYGTNVDTYSNYKTWTSPNSITEYPSWLQYKFADKKVTPYVFEYMSSHAWGYGCSHKIKIQGSNDGENWTDLTEEIQCDPFKKYEIYPTKNIDGYQYFRLNVLSRTETYYNRTDVLLFQVYGFED